MIPNPLILIKFKSGVAPDVMRSCADIIEKGIPRGEILLSEDICRLTILNQKLETVYDSEMR